MFQSCLIRYDRAINLSPNARQSIRYMPIQKPTSSKPSRQRLRGYSVTREPWPSSQYKPVTSLTMMSRPTERFCISNLKPRCRGMPLNIDAYRPVLPQGETKRESKVGPSGLHLSAARTDEAIASESSSKCMLAGPCPLLSAVPRLVYMRLFEDSFAL